MHGIDSSYKDALREMVATLRNVRERLVQGYQKLSKREKGMLIAAGCVIGLWALYALYQPIHAAFEDQNRRFNESKRELELGGIALARYSKLKARREAIEAAYREVEIKEGALSYLEQLLKSKVGVASGMFTINERGSRQFGKDYEQTSYNLRFPINDMARLVEFLEELVRGKQPLLLSSLALRRSLSSTSGDKLDVEIEVSAIQRSKSQ